MIGLELLMWSCPQHLLSTPSIHGPPVVLEVVDPPKKKGRWKRFWPVAMLPLFQIQFPLLQGLHASSRCGGA